MSIKWCRNCKSIGLRCANRLVPLGANLLAYVVQIAGAISVQIDNWFSLGQSTISGKSKMIRELFDMGHFDTNWCLPSKMMDNPLIWMVAFDGYIVDVRSAPYEMQVAAYEAGVIPFIPAQKK